MRFTLVAVGAAAMMAGSVQAGTVTWKETVASGTWHTAANWDTGVQPAESDDVIINSGIIQFWGPQTNNGASLTIRNGGSVTMNGGSVSFGGNYGVNIGTGGTGAGSVMTIHGGSFGMGGNLSVGSDAGGEAGTLTIGPEGTFNAGGASRDVYLRPTGIINSAGTVGAVGVVVPLGGVINITGGTFDVTRINFGDNTAMGSWLNVAGGTLTANNSVGTLDEPFGWGGRYFNFLENSTGLLVLPNVPTDKLEQYVTNGYIRLDGVASPESFVVTSFGENGSPVSVVTEPASAALLGLGLAVLGRRRRSVVA